MSETNRKQSYFIYLMVMMGLVHVLDVVVSNVGSLTRTAVAITYFPGLSLEDAVARMGLIGMLQLAVLLFQPIIKVMTDKYGRKPMILVSILGMSIGNLIMGFAPVYIVYVIGSAIAIYFLAADIQLLLIAEEAPKEKRGFWILFTIFLGNLGTLLVPFAKGIFISDDYSTNNWQFLYIIGAVFGVVLFFIMMFTMKESKAYLAAKELGELEIRSGKRFSLVTAFKDLRRSASWGKLKWYILGGGVFFMIPAMVFVNYTETTLSSYGYLESEKNIMLYIRIGFSVCWFLFSGWLSDVIGRKKVLIIDQLMFIVGEILYLILIRQHNIYGAGLAWGFMFAGTWGFMNLNVMATAEIIPTKLRATANGFRGLITMAVTIFAVGTLSVLLDVFESFDLLFYIGIPFTLLLILIVFKKYDETKGIILEDIKE